MEREKFHPHNTHQLFYVVFALSNFAMKSCIKSRLKAQPGISWEA